MTSRREFLQIGIAASAWPLVAGARAGDGSVLAAHAPIYKVVFDRRHAASVAFAAGAEAQGIATGGFDGDMTRLWLYDIREQWQREPVAIAGMTEHGPRFCFEQLGRDCGLRLITSHAHAPVLSGLGRRVELHTWLIGPRPSQRRLMTR